MILDLAENRATSESIFRKFLEIDILAKSSMGVAEENEVNDPPHDGVTTVQYFPSTNNIDSLLVSSWDGSLRVYDTARNSCVYKWTNIDDVPLLDCCWSNSDAGKAFSGDLDGNIWQKSMMQHGSDATLVGKHDGGVKCVEYSEPHRKYIAHFKIIKLCF